MKKLAVVLLLFLLLCAFPAGYAGAADTLDAGSCGSNLLWVLDSDGILTISGQGDMYDYAGDSTDDPPWYHLRTSITKVHVTDSVTDIGNYAFWSCDNLSDIVLPAALTSIGAGAFGGCSMSSINLPQSLESIGDHAFSNCERLTSITIPEGVTSIGDYTFSNCGKLTSADLPDGITDIGYGAFSDCVRLSYITLPDSVQSIGDYAFSNCSGLTGITVPDGTTDIGSWAFAYSGLTGITIPNSVVRIGDSAFSGCNSLSQVNYGGTAAQWAEISIGSDNAPLLTAELNSIQALSIAEQPVDYTGAVGSTATFKVVAEGDGLTYQWYCKKTGATSFAKSTLSSATKATLSLTLQEKHDSYQYYCKVKDSHGNSVNSNTVKITVGTPLKITTQPVNFTGAAGSTASLKVVAQGDGLTYQWYCKKTGATSFAKSTLSSATKTTLSLTLQEKHDSYQYYCKVKDSHGNSVNSNTVKITVGTPLKITTQPVNFTGAAGSTASLKVVAQGDGLTYQ